MKMKSAVELLEGLRAELESLLREFLLECSGLEKREMSGGGITIIGPNHSWKPLDGRGRALQEKLLREHSRFASFVQVLLRLSPERNRKNVVDATETVRPIIDQSDMTYTSTAKSGAR